jgi:hypothetical protein
MLNYLLVHRFHHLLSVTLAGRDSLWKRFRQSPQVFWSELHIQRGRILFQIFAAFGSGDRDDVVALRQYPGQCQL